MRRNMTLKSKNGRLVNMTLIVPLDTVVHVKGLPGAFATTLASLAGNRGLCILLWENLRRDGVPWVLLPTITLEPEDYQSLRRELGHVAQAHTGYPDFCDIERLHDQINQRLWETEKPALRQKGKS